MELLVITFNINSLNDNREKNLYDSEQDYR